MEPSHNSHYRNSLQATSSVPQAKGNQPIKIILKLNLEKKTLKIQLQFQLHPMAVLPCSTTAFVLWLCSISLHPHPAIAPGDSEQLHSTTWPAPCETSLCFEKSSAICTRILRGWRVAFSPRFLRVKFCQQTTVQPAPVGCTPAPPLGCRCTTLTGISQSSQHSLKETTLDLLSAESLIITLGGCR